MQTYFSRFRLVKNKTQTMQTYFLILKKSAAHEFRLESKTTQTADSCTQTIVSFFAAGWLSTSKGKSETEG